MGILNKLFRKETKEEIKTREKIEKLAEQGIDPQATLVENEILCNACGKVINTGVPKFLNHDGKRMVFHKGCLKKIKSGNLSF